ncbi:calcium-binding protein, partial [Rhizobiaceae sp. 2RAB30]
NDTIRSSISLSLDAAGRQDVENLILTGLAVDGTGNALHNQITGNGLGNTLNGQGGSDSLFGMDGNDTLFGGTGNDFLNGGAGADTMRGEAGNDTYVVDNVDDVVIETSNAGTDAV